MCGDPEVTDPPPTTMVSESAHSKKYRHAAKLVLPAGEVPAASEPVNNDTSSVSQPDSVPTKAHPTTAKIIRIT